MWQYQYTDELYHHGILGMKWGHRKQVAIDNRREKAIKKYNDIQLKNPNSRKALKAHNKAIKVAKSRYGRTNGQLLTKGIMKGVGSAILQGAAAAGLLASGAAATAPALAMIGAVSIGAIGSTYQFGNAVSTVNKIIKNYKPEKVKK